MWEFERWLEPLSWSMYRDLQRTDIDLITSLQSTFAKFDYEGASEAALRRDLVALMPLAQEEYVIASIRITISLKQEAKEDPAAQDVAILKETSVVWPPTVAPEIPVVLYGQ